MYNIEIKHGANIKNNAVSKYFIPKKKIYNNNNQKNQIMFEFLIYTNNQLNYLLLLSQNQEII